MTWMLIFCYLLLALLLLSLNLRSNWPWLSLLPGLGLLRRRLRRHLGLLHASRGAAFPATSKLAAAKLAAANLAAIAALASVS